MTKYIVPFVLIAMLSSCGGAPEQATSDEAATVSTSMSLTDAQLKNSDVRTGKIMLRSISEELKVNGKIEVPPQNMVSISVPLGGYLKSSKLLPGMHVSKGEVIAIMEDQQYIQIQQDFLMAKAHLVSKEAEFVRQKELNQTKASSDKVLEIAQAEYTAQKIMVKSLSEKLKLIGINPDNLDENTISKSIDVHSPIDGFVSVVNINIGKYVAPTDVLFELVNPSDIHLALSIFEKDLDKIAIGQKVIAYTNNNPDKTYVCEIILIGKDISPERSVVVHCHFEEFGKSLIPGMYMNARIEVATNSAYVIANDGLVRFEGKQYVFMETGDKTYDMQEVTTGFSEKGFTQVSFADNGGMADKTFVLQGAYTLLMAMKNSPEEE